MDRGPYRGRKENERLMSDQFEQMFLLFVFGLIIVGAGWVALRLSPCGNHTDGLAASSKYRGNHRGLF